MMLIDEILEYLQYHPMSKRQDIEGMKRRGVHTRKLRCS